MIKITRDFLRMFHMPPSERRLLQVRASAEKPVNLRAVPRTRRDGRRYRSSHLPMHV